MRLLQGVGAVNPEGAEERAGQVARGLDADHVDDSPSISIERCRELIALVSNQGPTDYRQRRHILEKRKKPRENDESVI
jgi:hypothetical protein